MAKIKIELVKSTIGASPYQKKVGKALGLGKLHSTVEVEDSPQVRGSIAKVSHLLKVE